MSQLPVSISGSGNAALVSRRMLTRAIVTVALLIGGIVTVHTLEAAMHATFDKPPAPLQKPLFRLSKELGSPTRYVASKPDEILDPEMIETLGTSEYLVRQYRDTTMKEGDPGSLVNLNLNFYATGSSTPHVPEICWAGSGREEADVSRITFDVNDVPRSDGSTVNLKMRMISFKPVAAAPTQDAAGNAIYSNVAYVFQVNGDYVANTQEVTSHFWKASYRYAYHCKIEITPLDPRFPSGQVVLDCTQDQAKKMVAEFIRSALPAIESCLPDRAILTAAPDESTGKSH